jgi:hypothetical protein
MSVHSYHEGCREAFRDPANLDRIASSLIEHLTSYYQEGVSLNHMLHFV